MIRARSNLEGEARRGLEVDIQDLKKDSTPSRRCCRQSCIAIFAFACSSVFGLLESSRFGLLCLQTKVTQEVNLETQTPTETKLAHVF